tara:strand:- start:872 stop:1042 length:171 start_codon:yes stop_codon:yes gene_type:complete
MEGISKELNDEIEKECRVRKAELLAKEKAKIKLPKTRRAIEDYKELTRLIDDYYND